MPNIKLQSSDGEIFDTDVQIVKCSGTIETMLKDYCLENGKDKVVRLPNVSSVILRKVLHFADFHKDDPQPAEDEYTYDISSWDADFLKLDTDTIFELILAANYLDIKGLLEVTCRTVANMIRCKTPDEIRNFFTWKNDPTAAAEEHISKEKECCEEKSVVVEVAEDKLGCENLKK